MHADLRQLSYAWWARFCLALGYWFSVLCTWHHSTACSSSEMPRKKEPYVDPLQALDFQVVTQSVRRDLARPKALPLFSCKLYIHLRGGVPYNPPLPPPNIQSVNWKSFTVPGSTMVSLGKTKLDLSHFQFSFPFVKLKEYHLTVRYICCQIFPYTVRVS